MSYLQKHVFRKIQRNKIIKWRNSHVMQKIVSQTHNQLYNFQNLDKILSEILLSSNVFVLFTKEYKHNKNFKR